MSLDIGLAYLPIFISHLVLPQRDGQAKFAWVSGRVCDIKRRFLSFFSLCLLFYVIIFVTFDTSSGTAGETESTSERVGRTAVEGNAAWGASQ